MLQHLKNWRNLEYRSKDARIVTMYKIANENVAITKQDRLKRPWVDHRTWLLRLSLSLGLLVRLYKDKNSFSSYVFWLELAPTNYSGETFKTAFSSIKY
jgi:hypothetical protein